MENEWPKLPEEEDKTEKKTRKRRLFWPPWLLRKDENQAEAQTDEAEIDKPDRRWRNVLGRFFGRHVTSEPLEPNALPSFSGPEAAMPSLEDARTFTARDMENTSKESKDRSRTEENTLRIERQPESEPSHAVVAEQPAFTAFPIPEQYRRLDHIDSSTVDEPQFETKPYISEDKQEIVQNVSRREPLAAVTLLGLGAEYISRKSENRAQNKRIERIERDAKEQKKDQWVEQAELQTIRRKQEVAEHAPRPSITKERRPLSPEHLKSKEMPKPEVAIEKSLPPVRQEMVIRDREKLAEEVARKVEQYERHNEAPETVLKEMLTAAEVDAPVERIYERRQEIRDEPTKVTAGSSPASVGTILQQMSVPTTVPSTLSLPSDRARQPLDSQLSPHLYKQAAQRGFWSAIVILIFALMVYLLG